MYINSPGGIVTSGLSIYDTIRYIKPKISTLLDRQPLWDHYCSCRKRAEFSLPNSRIMVHQPSGDFQGQASDIALHAKEILLLKERLNLIYVEHTGQKLSELKKLSTGIIL